MGRKLDLTGLTDVEAEHVMQVVQRDMELRKTEETRLNEMKKALVEEGSRSVLLSRQHRFNERCCIRCCSLFTFLLNPKRSCLDCCYNLCLTYISKHLSSHLSVSERLYVCGFVYTHGLMKECNNCL
uniref:RabBD domain-containing protein n=1 Tax=Sinocyclocheilus anshuiensis TaxID=1608454 RepID=A0A671L898_9TELE